MIFKKKVNAFTKMSVTLFVIMVLYYVILVTIKGTTNMDNFVDHIDTKSPEFPCDKSKSTGPRAMFLLKLGDLSVI
jgi:hypothetical protein